LTPRLAENAIRYIKIMKNKHILLVNIPFSFVQIKLCPLEQLSIETLKLISMLKQDNEVSFINMRSKGSFAWNIRRAGIDSGTKLQMSIAAKSQQYLIKNIRQLEVKPDLILIICNFSFSPYTFDLEAIKSIANICRQTLPDIPVKICGGFIDLFPDIVKELKNDIDIEKIEIDGSNTDKYTPDLSCMAREKYGLFQLIRGCTNNCSFCVAARTKLSRFDIDETISYMKKLYEKYHIDNFWNWDQNVLLYPEYFEKFLDKYLQADIKASLNFALGFQPDLISDRLIKKLSKLNLGALTIPFETGSANSFENIKKPYTIISSLKRLAAINRYAKRAVKRIQSSFIIGYKHDDLSSIFRIYLSILRMKSFPLPFPLYIFPNTEEYNINKQYLETKSISELHGQLWPLISKDKIKSYQNLLKFLLIDNLEQAKDNLSLLTDEMKEVFLEELKINDYFVDACLESEKEDLDTLLSIEQKLKAYKKRKENLLYISASARSGLNSTSNMLGDFFCRQYKEHNSEAEINYINLAQEPIEFINEEYVDFINHKLSHENLSEKTIKMLQLTEKYIKMLRYADKILISTPMYTLSVPAILKAFFELIASRMFYDLGDSFSKKKVCCIITRDGVYHKNNRDNVQEHTIRAFFNFMGLSSGVDFICAEGLYIEERQESVINNTKEKILNYIKGVNKSLKTDL
jgi:FMN-dependent NADH-azoreductase